MEQEITGSDLAEFIKIVREEADWNIQQMSAATGIPASTLSNYQNQVRFPNNVEKVVQAIQSAIKRVQIERRERGW